MKLRTIAMTGVLSLAGLGLVGAGAHAVFTQNTVSSQTISSGSLGVVLWANGASGDNTATITLATPPNVGSSFTTGDQLVKMINNGTIAATESTVTLSGVTTYGATNDLLNGLQVCVATNNNLVIYNGSLVAVSGSPLTYYGGTTIAASGGSDYYFVNIYAGNEPTMCGNDTANEYADTYGTDSTSNSSALGSNSAEGESVSVSLTVGYTG
jgi:predicted ribosomally synthesized peptide with SipW-like signal peptide